MADVTRCLKGQRREQKGGGGGGEEGGGRRSRRRRGKRWRIRIAGNFSRLHGVILQNINLAGCVAVAPTVKDGGPKEGRSQD